MNLSRTIEKNGIVINIDISYDPKQTLPSNQHDLHTHHDPKLAPDYTFQDRHELEDSLKTYIPYFLESYIISDHHWFFITSLEAYYPDPNLDDCAHPAWPHRTQPEPHLTLDHHFRHPFHRLSIFFGRFEFLVTGGFWWDGQVRPFLGSAIRGLTEIKRIRWQPSGKTTDYRQTTRLLRDLSGRDALAPFGFYSDRVMTDGIDLDPVGPLGFEREMGCYAFYRLGSFVFRVYGEGGVEVDRFGEVREGFLKGRWGEGKRSFGEVLAGMAIDQKRFRLEVIRRLVKLEEWLEGKEGWVQVRQSGESKRQIKKSLCAIMHEGFYEGLRKKRIKKVDQLKTLIDEDLLLKVFLF